MIFIVYDYSYNYIKWWFNVCVPLTLWHYQFFSHYYLVPTLHLWFSFSAAWYILNQFFQWSPSLSTYLRISLVLSQGNLFGYECRKTDTHFQYLKYLIFWHILFGYADWCITRLFVISLRVRHYLFSFSNIQFQCLLGFSCIYAFVFSVPLSWSL